MATRIDESRLRRSATSTGSSINTTSVAVIKVQRGQPCAACSAWALPTNNNCASGWDCKKLRQAGKVTDGPWSPPMQSTARRTRWSGCKTDGD